MAKLSDQQKSLLSALGLAFIAQLDEQDKLGELLLATEQAGAGQVPQTIAQQSAEAKKLGGGAQGPPKKVATAKGEAHYKVPIGSLIIPHFHYVKGQPSHWIPNVSAAKWAANQWKGHEKEAAEAAEKAVHEGTHHWVQAGEHTYAVHNGLDVHVQKDTDLANEADVKNKPKIVVKHGDNPEHVQLTPSGPSETFHHWEHAADILAKNWKKLPPQPPKKSVAFEGKHAAWVPSEWQVHKAPKVDEKLAGKFAKDPEGNGHYIDKNGSIKDFKADQIDNWIAQGKLVPDSHPGPEPEHVAPNQGKEGAEPVKVQIGGVHATKEQIQDAIAALQASQSTAVKQPLQKAGNPLADMDYHDVAQSEFAQFPELKIDAGTKKKHVGAVKLAVLHRLSRVLDQVAKTEAEQDVLQAAQDKAQAQAAHAQELTPHQHTIGEVPKQPEAAAPAKAPVSVTIPAAPGQPGLSFGAGEQEIKDAIEILQNSKSTAVKQPLAKAGSFLANMDYHKINEQELAAHPELKVTPGSKQAHVGQVKTSVLHFLEGKLKEFQSGGVQVSKEAVQEAIPMLESSMGLAGFKTKLKAASSPLAALDFAAIITKYMSEHPNTTKASSSKEVLLAWLNSHLGDMAKADQETGHDQAAEIAALVQGVPEDLTQSLKDGWEFSSDGSTAAALVAASVIGTPVYAALSSDTPGKWNIYYNFPPPGKAAMKATPEHKLSMLYSDGQTEHEVDQAKVLDILKQWIKKSAEKPKPAKQVSPEKETPPAKTLAQALQEITQEKKPPPPPPSALLPAGQWMDDPNYQEIHGLVAGLGNGKLPKGKDTDSSLAVALWASWVGGKDAYMQANPDGEWYTASVPPQPGTWGAQTIAGYYHVTNNHQIVHVDKQGNETALSSEHILQIAGKLKPPEPKAPEQGQLVVHGNNFPPGSAAYKKTGTTSVYVHLPSGSWARVFPSGQLVPKTAAAYSYMYGNWLKNGVLIPWTPEPAAALAPEGVQVKIGGSLLTTAPAGTSLWHFSHANPFAEGFKIYMKYPDNTWHVISKESPTAAPSANSAAKLDSFVQTGGFVPYNDVAKQLVEAAKIPENGEPAEPELPAGQIAPDVKVVINGQEVVAVPAGSKIYYGSSSNPETTTTKYVLFPDGTMAYYNKDGVKNPLGPHYLKFIENGGLLPEPVKVAGAQETQPPPSVPEGEPVPVIWQGAVIGTVPAGSKLYKYNAEYEKNYGKKLFGLAPDGTWYEMGQGVYKMKYSVPTPDKIVEVPPPSGADLEHAQDVAKLKDLVSNGSVPTMGNSGDLWKFAAYQLTSKSGNYIPDSLTVFETTAGHYTYGYAVSGKDHWIFNGKTMEVTHVTGTKQEQIPFDEVKANLTQHVVPNSVLLSNKPVKHGLYYNPKGKAYLEIKPSKGGAYYTYKKASYLWHGADGSVKTVTHNFAIKQLEKNTEWHPLDSPKDFGTPTSVSKVKYATTAQPGIYGIWSDKDGAGGPEQIELKADGSAVYTNVDVPGIKNPLISADPVLKGGAVIDQYGTTVVQPGLQPDHYHVQGSPAVTKAQLQEALQQIQENMGQPGWKDAWYSLFGGQSEWQKQAPYGKKFFNDKGGIGGANEQQQRIIALLNELLLVPEAQPVATTEPKFLKGLPEGINTPQQIFKWTDTGYATPHAGGIDLYQLGVGAKVYAVSKIKDISQAFGNGKVVGTHTSSLSSAEAMQWLTAWKKGDMQTVFALDASGGKVSPVHPGAPDNTATHAISWAPWDPGQVPASKTIEGTWTPLDVTPSLAEIQNYLIKVNVQHAAYLTAAEWRKLVKAHREHDQDVVDQLSQKATEAYNGSGTVMSVPPKWTDDVKPAKSYDVFLEDGKGVQQWSQQAVKDYAAEHEAELLPFAIPVAKEYGYDNYSAKESLNIYTKKVIQRYLDDVKEKEEAEKLRPKYHLVPGDPNRVTDEVTGKTFLWSTGTKKELNRKVAVAALARAWGFRIPLSQHAFLEDDKTPGIITPEVQPLQTLASLDSQGITLLTDRELSDIAREHILDYALANHGSTPGSYLRMPDGSIISASKEDAFGDLTWAGAHRTGMNDWAKQPVSLIFDAIANGGFSKDRADTLYLAAVQGARRMQGLSDARLLQVLKSTGLSEADMEAVLGRKAALATDIQGLWDSVFQAAGWRPPEVPEAKLSHGLHSGFSEPEFLPHVLAGKAFGVPAFFAGGDLTNGNVLVWTEIGPKGDRRLRGETAARKEAIDKIMGWVKAHSGEQTAKMVPKDDGMFHGSILDAAEGVKSHSDPSDYSKYGNYSGPIMTDVFTKYAQTKAELQKRLSAAESALAKGPASSEYQLVASQYGDPGAVASMAKHYLAQMETIDNAKSVNGGMGFTPDQFPGWTPANYQSVAAAGVKITYKKASRELGSNSGQLTADSWQLGKDDGELHLKAGLKTEYQGYMWELELPDGEVIDINDSGDTQTPPGQQGRIRFKAVTENGSASLENIRSFLQEVGLNMDEATQPDMELLYWRLAASTLADRVDRKAGPAMQAWTTAAKEAGITSLKKLAYIGKLADEIAAKHLSAEEESAIWRKAFANFTSEQQIQQFVDNHGYLPHLGHFDIRSPEVVGGKPEWYRFDVTPEQVAAKPLLVNHLHDSGKDAVLVARTGGLFSGEGRLRALGTYKPGMSWASDQSYGSGGAVFLRQNMQSSHSSYQVWISPRVMARMQTYSWNNDHFGQIALKRSHAHWDFATATSHSNSGNEAMVADAVSFLDDVEVLQANSEAQRQTIIKDLKAAGLTHIRGLPVEDRVVSGSAAVATAIKKAKDQAKKNVASWFAQPDEQQLPYTGATEAQAQAAESGQAAEQAAVPADSAEYYQQLEEQSAQNPDWSQSPSGKVWVLGNYEVIQNNAGTAWDVWTGGTFLQTFGSLATAKWFAEQHGAGAGLTSADGIIWPETVTDAMGNKIHMLPHTFTANPGYITSEAIASGTISSTSAGNVPFSYSSAGLPGEFTTGSSNLVALGSSLKDLNISIKLTDDQVKEMLQNFQHFQELIDSPPKEGLPSDEVDGDG